MKGIIVSIVMMAVAVSSQTEPKVVVTGNVVVVDSGGTEGRFSLPDRPIRVLRKGNLVFAAVPKHGVYVLDITSPSSPKLVSVVEKGRDIRDIAIRDGALVVTTGEMSLKVFDIASGEPRDAVATLMSSKGAWKEERVGTVTSVDRGWAVISLVEGAPVAPGTRVEIRSSVPVTKTDPFTGKRSVGPSGRIVFVGDIQEVRGHQASVRLSKGDFPRRGDSVYLSERSVSGSLWAPARLSDGWRAFMEVYPQITGQSSEDEEGESYLSVLMRAGIYYHGFGPWSAGFELTPFQYFGHSEAEGTNSIGGAGYLMVNYETDLFAVGLGIGYQYPLMADESIDGKRIEHNRKGVALVQQARLGALDGLHVLVRYQSVYCKDNFKHETRGMWGHLYMRLAVPLEMRSDLLVEGLFSPTLVHTTVGIRLAFQGMGGPGTTYLKAYMGYMNFMPYMASRDVGSEKDVAVQMEGGGGPVIGVGFEQRW